MHNLLCRVVFTVDKLYWSVFILPIDGVYSMFTIIILFGLLSTDDLSREKKSPSHAFPRKDKCIKVCYFVGK